MNLISVLVALVIFGGLLYIVQLLPIDALVKRIIYVVAALAMFVWALQAFGLMSGMPRLG